ncbi:MAG: glycogen/starch/alpha-glucan phosphorylase [Oscillospiraceae bacterium]|nr:glycogen/starch/alpha-glucan phosphorylase [Oscillospiraceae bacterium]
MKSGYTKEQIKEMLRRRLLLGTDVESDIVSTPDSTYYKAVAYVVRNISTEKRSKFLANNLASGKKQVYYLSMEFLLGRSLKTSLMNLGLADVMAEALADYDVRLEDLYEHEPDAGLGNGGLGRLAACYLDAMAHEGYLATGYCILYEFGIFKQKIIDGWQTEKPDDWLPGGQVWLHENPMHSVEVKFGGKINEHWEGPHHHIDHVDYTSVIAVPYDINVTGYNSPGVSLLRVWRAKTPAGMDMDSFNRGDYATAFRPNSAGEIISKVLYPNDNHNEGKALRLRQQYFLCAASIADICRRHLAVYGTLANFAEKNSIHINDTHPTLAIPELMRFLLDDCGYGWDVSWQIVTGAFGYTNHTVMSEALEVWDETLVKNMLPRIFDIICEINRRFCTDLYEKQFVSSDIVARMSIVRGHQIHMANLAIAGSHCVNGVSALHSDIIKQHLFKDFSAVTPDKFTNVTNGIASRRWLLGANPSLTKLIQGAIGKDFADNMQNLEKLMQHTGDSAFLKGVADSKRENKERFCKYYLQKTGISLDPSSIFDVQVKRLHEYKRQQLNALDIIATWQYLRENRDADFVPHTYIFGAKAAPGYFLAKQIIKLICEISDAIERDPVIREKMRVVFLEEYNVTMSELLMPASDISEQISLAGTEASGTGNMKLMLNGAVTLGTLDGANVEIREHVGDENIFIFGMTSRDVEALRQRGYNPRAYYEQGDVLRRAVDALMDGFDSTKFPDIYSAMVNTDQFMTLADFDSYRAARRRMVETYRNRPEWSRMSLVNTAKSAFFCADRSVQEYARKIWGMVDN